MKFYIDLLLRSIDEAECQVQHTGIRNG